MGEIAGLESLRDMVLRVARNSKRIIICPGDGGKVLTDKHKLGNIVVNATQLTNRRCLLLRMMMYQ